MPAFNPQKLALPSFNEAQVLTVLAELSAEVEDLKAKVKEARLLAESTKAELAGILSRLDTLRATIQRGEKDIEELSEKIGAENDQILSLHQDVAILKQKAEEIKEEIAKLGRSPSANKLKRERARLNVRIEDKEAELSQLKPQVEADKKALEDLEARREENNHQYRAVQKELSNLQAMLPSPYLYTDLYSAVTKEAHANYYLDKDSARWAKTLGGAFGIVYDLSCDIRSGKYRLDRYSDLIGGRSTASVEALYSAVLLGHSAKALEFFKITSDPALYFHNIFNIMRFWLMGFYLDQKWAPMRELLRYYRHSDGMRSAYVEAWLAILDGNQVLFDRAIRFIVRYEFQSATAKEGPELISLPALTLAKLALRHGLQCNIKVQTVPQELLKAALAW